MRAPRSLLALALAGCAALAAAAEEPRAAGPGAGSGAAGGLDALEPRAGAPGEPGEPGALDMEQLQKMMAGMGGGGMDGMDLSQMMGGMGGAGGMGGLPAQGVEEDVKFILCETCQAMVREAFRVVRELRSSLSKTKLSESRVDELLGQLCEYRELAGKWLTQYDMVERADGSRIDLVHMAREGACNAECKTLELACKLAWGEIASELVEAAFLAKKSEADVAAKLCGKRLKREAGACGRPYPALPKDRPAGDAFAPKSEEQLAMDDINRKMRASGMGKFNVKDEL